MEGMRRVRRQLTTRAIKAAAGLAVLVGLNCHRSGIVEVWIFNQTPSTLQVAGQTVNYWTSGWTEIAPGDTARLPIARDSQSLGTLVVNSLVAQGDANRYGAVVNVRQDSLSHLFIEEYSPYVDAQLVSP
jgi:hypothetical protein